MEGGKRICKTCGNRGNAEEMVANRIMVYCPVIGSMVFSHNEGECFVWKPEE
jgi:hypothetical protein